MSRSLVSSSARLNVGLAVVGAVFLIASSVVADDWNQFRGPHGNGIADVDSAPSSWSEEENVQWKTEIPGRGWSSPVVAAGKIWLTTASEIVPDEEEKRKLLKDSGVEERKFKQLKIAKQIRLQAVEVDFKSGALVRTIDLLTIAKPDPIHSLNSYASPTPVIDEGKLYCHFGTYGTICLNTSDGSVKWRRTLPLEHGVGPGSSPFIDGQLLVLICDGVDRQYVTALDKETGETIWETKRPEMDAASGDQKKAYCTPIALTDKRGRRQLVCMGSQWLVSYDPKTGKEIWKVRHGRGFSVVPRPVYANEVVHVSTGFGKPQLYSVRVDGDGDVSDSHVVWKETRNIPAKPSPLLSEGLLYVIEDKGVATCFDASNGKEHWKERLAGNFSASPLLADGKIYLSSQEGEVTVIGVGRDYKVIATNRIDGEIMASPIALDGSLVLRSDKAIYRIGK